jgi:hypothetical protein
MYKKRVHMWNLSCSLMGAHTHTHEELKVCFSAHHEDIWRSGDIAPLILDFSIDVDELSDSRPSHLSHGEIGPGTHWIEVGEKSLCLCRECNHVCQLCSPYCSHYATRMSVCVSEFIYKYLYIFFIYMFIYIYLFVCVHCWQKCVT